MINAPPIKPQIPHFHIPIMFGEHWCASWCWCSSTRHNPRLSMKPPNRRKRLLTFTDRKSKQKKVSDIERERKLQIECWKKRIAFTSSTGTQIMNAYQQCIELPRAIATSDGLPVKCTKVNSTKVYTINCHCGGNFSDQHYTMECSQEYRRLCWLFT